MSGNSTTHYSKCLDRLMSAAFLQASLGFAIGVVQCGLIYVGPRLVRQTSDERKSQHEETMRALNIQHEATMHALRELIARTAK